MTGANDKTMSAYAAGKLLAHVSGGKWGPVMLMLGGMALMKMGAELREGRHRKLETRRAQIKGRR
jgi:hypothetical protein